jgi:hypothetical protein
VFAVPAAWDLLVAVAQARQRLPPVPWAIAGGLALGALLHTLHHWYYHTTAHPLILVLT